MRRCRLNGSDGQQGEDRSGVDPVKALRRFLRFTVAPDFEIRIGTAACASVGARYRFTRPGRGRGQPVVPVTGGRTWTQVRAPRTTRASSKVFSKWPAAADSCRTS